MLLPFDELNNLRSEIEARAYIENGVLKYPKDDCIDLVLDALILAYVYGVDYANETLGTDIPSDTDKMTETIYKKIADKDFSERVSEYADKGSLEELMRVVETEMTRDFSGGVLDTGETGGAKYKTWVTMLDDRVRDTHYYLEGKKIPMEERFFTFDGDSAKHPGDFAKAENNCNCRCVLKVTNT